MRIILTNRSRLKICNVFINNEMLYIFSFDEELATNESKAMFKNTIISKLHSHIFTFKRTKL